MKLAIVGSVSLAGREDVYRCIQVVLVSAQPELLISGGAEGVDTMAAEVATMLDIPVREYLPDGKSWSFYKARNLKIAQECDHLVRIAVIGSKTYGSGWTRDRAAEMGKHTNETLFPVEGPFYPSAPPFWIPYPPELAAACQVKFIREGEIPILLRD